MLVPASQISVRELAPCPRGVRRPRCGLRGHVAGGREAEGLEGAGQGQVTRGPVASVRTLDFPSRKVERPCKVLTSRLDLTYVSEALMRR